MPWLFLILFLLLGVVVLLHQGVPLPLFLRPACLSQSGGVFVFFVADGRVNVGVQRAVAAIDDVPRPLRVVVSPQVLLRRVEVDLAQVLLRVLAPVYDVEVLVVGVDVLFLPGLVRLGLSLLAGWQRDRGLEVDDVVVDSVLPIIALRPPLPTSYRSRSLAAAFASISMLLFLSTSSR